VEDYDYFQRHKSIKGVEVKGTDRLFLLDFENKNYHELFEKEFTKEKIAGLYLLINSKTNEIYVGESTNTKERNKSEIKNGVNSKKLKDWKFDKIILIWDGRPTNTSLFGEDSFRKVLEKACIQIFKDDDSYVCKNSVGKPKPTNIQTKTTVENFKNHISLLLKMHGLINTKN